MVADLAQDVDACQGISVPCTTQQTAESTSVRAGRQHCWGVPVLGLSQHTGEWLPGKGEQASVVASYQGGCLYLCKPCAQHRRRVWEC